VEPGVITSSSHVSTIDLPIALTKLGPSGLITSAASLTVKHIHTATLPLDHTLLLPCTSRSMSVGRSGLSVCQEHNITQKRMICSNLIQRTNLGYPTSGMVLGLKGQRSKLRLGLTAIRRGFDSTTAFYCSYQRRPLFLYTNLAAALT